MARKIFISVLGTGFYNECNYYSADFVFKTRFIQQATLAMLASQSNWTNEDAAYILLTDRAKSDNWQIPTSRRKNPKKAEDEEYIGLKETLEAMQLPMLINDVGIEDGKTEKEMWNIFDKIYELLKDGDELYFDITHGFRYLPMFVIVLGNYAKFLKNITVKGITYGNFEARTEKGAPIMSLLSLSSLQDWTYAAADFLRHGDATRLRDNGSKELQPILKEAKGSDAAATNLKKLCTALSTFSEELSFCRGLDILSGKTSEYIKTLITDADKNYLRPFVPLFTYIEKVVESFKEQSPANIIYAAHLCFEFGNYQASATLLEEGIVTFFCIRHNIDITDIELRKNVNKAFTKRLYLQKDKEKVYRPSSEENEKIIDDIANDELIDTHLINDFTCLQTDIRNDINHAGMRGKENGKKVSPPAKIKSLRSNLEKVLNSMEALVCNEKAEKNTSRKKLLINLSNHPSAEWQEEQRQAAHIYGTCIDMSFPQIDPSADDDQMESIVEKYTQQVKEYTKTHEVTVHIMGEMCFTYRLIKRLSAIGIKCICSTSYRLVHDEGNGKRYVEFHFKKFRNYEC